MGSSIEFSSIHSDAFLNTRLEEIKMTLFFSLKNGLDFGALENLSQKKTYPL
jgi:hypothetical protein